jgi:hypothetical protein
MSINSNDKDSIEQCKDGFFNQYKNRSEIPVEPVPKTREGIATKAVRDYLADKAIKDAQEATPESELQDLWFNGDEYTA